MSAQISSRLILYFLACYIKIDTAYFVDLMPTGSNVLTKSRIRNTGMRIQKELAYVAVS